VVLAPASRPSAPPATCALAALSGPVLR